jgi:putative transposase
MAHDLARYHRRSIRLPGFDYSQPGAYFVTICTDQQKGLLGEIANGEMIQSKFGLIGSHWIALTQAHFPEIQILDWVVMPNHVHMIIEIIEAGRGAVSAPNSADADKRLGGETPLVQGRGAVSAPNGADADKRQGGETPPVQGRGAVPAPKCADADERQGGKTPPVQGDGDKIDHWGASGTPQSLLAQIIAYYKYQTTKQINKLRKTPGATFWQRNYHEHVIRNENEYRRI